MAKVLMLIFQHLLDADDIESANFRSRTIRKSRFDTTICVPSPCIGRGVQNVATGEISQMSLEILGWVAPISIGDALYWLCLDMALFHVPIHQP